ncbi:MAG: sugar phosphate isomerase/epimerase family protein [Planctomycetaceae bacterium]
MKRKIGVITNSFRLPTLDSIRKAAQIGVDGFQIYCCGGEVSPESMDAAKRKEFRKFVADQGLVISALCADYGRGFLNAETNKEFVPKTMACMDLAADLGTKIITSHIGRLPKDASDPTYQAGLAAMRQIEAHGKKTGILFASETGPESGEDLRVFLDTVGGDYVKANYDPANLCMFGFDPISGVAALGKKYIAHTHAKDGLKGVLKEVPLGEGGVDFPKYLAALDAIGYDGFLTIEREVGENPAADIIKAVEFLRTM